jgi:hypothetical protein
VLRDDRPLHSARASYCRLDDRSYKLIAFVGELEKLLAWAYSQTEVQRVASAKDFTSNARVTSWWRAVFVREVLIEAVTSEDEIPVYWDAVASGVATLEYSPVYRA